MTTKNKKEPGKGRTKAKKLQLSKETLKDLSPQDRGDVKGGRPLPPCGNIHTQSSARFKEAIKPMDKASEAILALQPVAFRYKHELDPEGIPQFGLVAEQVEKVNSDLVVRDADGKVNAVRYEAVNAMLLNEFLKEHRKVQELEATVAQQQKDFRATTAQQQKEIEALSAGLQKVSAKVELSKGAPQVVENNR
jgi:hypothetical protein